MTLRTGLKLKTGASLATIEDLLEKNCQGEWNVGIDDVSAEDGHKALTIYFESPADKNAFITAYRALR